MPGYPMTASEDLQDFITSIFGLNTATIGFTYAGIATEYTEVLGTKIFLHPVSSYHVDDFLEALGNDKAAFGLVGHGLTERHILTAYKGDNNQIILFDSKRSDGERFLSNLWNPPFSFNAFFRTLFGFGDVFNINGQTVRYISLGTQSAWDGTTCGLHVAAMLNGIRQLCSRNEPITAESILDEMGNPVVDVVSALEDDNEIHEAISFRAFMNSAWNDTFLRNRPSDESARAYFFGWHGSENTLPFEPVFETLRSVLKLLTALPARVLAETGAFARKSLMETAPKNGFTQSLRSGAMLLTFAFEGMCRSVGMLFQTVLEPGRVIGALIEGRSQQARGIQGGTPYGSSDLPAGNKQDHDIDSDDDFVDVNHHVRSTAQSKTAASPGDDQSSTDEAEPARHLHADANKQDSDDDFVVVDRREKSTAQSKR
ncbi:hypothetical protein Lgee_1849 [Legionella geestiana]|uniref:Uncharacterized protein n=2 Tax=Legionella geestiana TaxID=45065 RepID=A0A0W0TNJ7_9GAMM|nr:hypothetical protein Lgee_1849 [Legionella geestiana]STX55241.1 Uncharacterised protein [Legionella geestiana]